MRRKTFLAAVLPLILILASCMTFSGKGKAFPVHVTDRAVFGLLPPSDMPELDSYQLLQGTMPGFGDVAMEAYLECDGQSLCMYLFAPTGQTLASIEYDGIVLDCQSSFIEDSLYVGYYVLADIQFCYADEEVLSEELASCGLEFVQKEQDGTIERAISSRKNEIYRITIMDGIVTVRNSLRGYEYSLEIL